MKKASFIAVLPVVVACSNPIRTSNPPEPMSTSAPTTKDASVTPPEVKAPEPRIPPEFYSKREKNPDGKCYVDVSGNPPYQVEVSCTAPLEPPLNGSTWCRVATAQAPEQKVGVDCDSPSLLPPSSFPKREKGPDGKCYVQMAGNPPYQEEVSCSEVPKPHTNGGCLVDMKRTPEQKIVIDCNS